MLALTLALASALQSLPQQAADVKTHVLVVSGISGDSVLRKDFFDNAKRVVDGVRTKYSIPDSMITYLAETPQLDPTAVRDSSTRGNIERAFAKIAKRAKPGDVVFVMLIGNGSAQGPQTSKFNIPGTPDMEAADFAKLLAPLAQQQVIFVNSTPSSGDFIGALAGKNRVIITSTSSPMERNYAKFAKYFSTVFTAENVDTDKDGQISMLEAFEYTRRKVEQDYKSAKLLQSEHATLEDNGDGKGVPTPELQASDGRIAARMFLTGMMPENPRITDLLNQYAALRMKIEGFVASRGSMDGETYGPLLEGMFVDLAVLSLKVRQGAGTP